MNEDQFVFSSNLDTEFLNSIYEGDKEHAQMIFEKFLASIGSQLEEIEAGYLVSDIELFRTKMHKLKPMLSFVGLTSLTAEAEIIEKKCKVIDDISVVAAAYQSFKGNLREMIPVIENELERLKT